MSPAPENLFRAFRECPYENTKVVLLDIEPSRHSDGLAYSSIAQKSRNCVTQSIFDSVLQECGQEPESADLTSWANQGVLLLNIHLSVDQKQYASHQHFGWAHFFRVVMEAYLLKPNPIIVAWGIPVQKFAAPYQERATILTSHHPTVSLYTRGELQFQGGFKTINQLLTASNQEPIQWTQQHILT